MTHRSPEYPAMECFFMGLETAHPVVMVVQRLVQMTLL